MREIKFRGWYIPKKVMLYDINPKDWVIGFDGRVYDHSTDYCGDGCMMDDDSGNFHLMQYTGLKDKNGREIYEGDIVATPERDVIFTVQFGTSEKAAACFYYEGTGGRKYEIDSAYNELEIIGNCFENPELVK